MAIPSANVVSPEERLMAAVAHSASLVPGIGLIIPLLIWTSQRKWSKFVSFHALQALVYQLVQMFLIIALSLLNVVFIFPILGVVMKALVGVEAPQFSMANFFDLGWMALLFCLFAFLALLGLAAGINILGRHDFLYPYLGKWLAHYLAEGEEDEV